jgi:ABC-type methionine transport system permease subunit
LTGLPNSTGVAAVMILVAGIAFTVIFTIGLSAIGGYIGRRMSS